MGFEVLVEIGLKWIVKKCLVALELNKKVFGIFFGNETKIGVLKFKKNDFVGF